MGVTEGGAGGFDVGGGFSILEDPSKIVEPSIKIEFSSPATNTDLVPHVVVLPGGTVMAGCGVGLKLISAGISTPIGHGRTVMTMELSGEAKVIVWVDGAVGAPGGGEAISMEL